MVLTLYHRLGCHLCEQMLNELQVALADLDLQVTLVDIDRDASLRQRFDDQVPVLAAGDDILCRHFLDEQRVRAYLSVHG